MKEFWGNLSDRERGLIIIAGALAGLVLTLQLIIAPAFQWRSDQQRRLDQAAADYELVAAAAQFSSLQMARDKSLAIGAVIPQSARAAGVTLVYVNARGSATVDVNIASVNPEELYKWIKTVDREHGVDVTTADIARAPDKPNSVRAQLTFERRGG